MSWLPEEIIPESKPCLLFAVKPHVAPLRLINSWSTTDRAALFRAGLAEGCMLAWDACGDRLMWIGRQLVIARSLYAHHCDLYCSTGSMLALHTS